MKTLGSEPMTPRSEREAPSTRRNLPKFTSMPNLFLLTDGVPKLS